MATYKTAKQVRGLQLLLGGEAHSGWLPPGAAEPLATPLRQAVVDVRIEYDGGSYLLICDSRNTDDSWDTWHATLEEAEEHAERQLGVRRSDWQSVGPEAR